MDLGGLPFKIPPELLGNLQNVPMSEFKDSSRVLELSLLSMPYPAPYLVYYKKEDGIDQWREGWNAFLEEQYHPDTPHPDITQFLDPIKDMLTMPHLAEMLYERTKQLLLRQKDLRNFLAQPSEEKQCPDILRLFQRRWFLQDSHVREQHIADGMAMAVRRATGIAGGNLEIGFALCPEFVSSFLNRDCGRGLLDLLYTLIRSDTAKHPLRTWPVIPEHARFDAMWKLGPNPPWKHTQQYVIAYKTEHLLWRAEALTMVLEAIVKNFLDYEIQFVGMKDKIGKHLLREDKKHRFMLRESRALVLELYKESFWLCVACGTTTPQKGTKMLQCSACQRIGRKVCYCSKGCQVNDWKRHKIACKKPARPPTAPPPRVPIEPLPKIQPIPPPKPGFKRSAALERQIAMIEYSDSPVCYWFIRCTKENINARFFGIPYQELLSKFETTRNEAFVNGDLPSVVELLVFLLFGAQGIDTPMAHVLDQMVEEFGFSATELLRGVEQSRKGGEKRENPFIIKKDSKYVPEDVD